MRTSDSYKPRPTAILAESESLLVAAALTGGPRDQRVEEAAYTLLEGRVPSVDRYILARAYANLYGGLLLVYKGSVVAPVSRLHYRRSLEVTPTPGMVEARILSDQMILDVWARIFIGDEEALGLLAGPMASPRGYVWRLGGGIHVAPSGFSGVRVEEAHDDG